MINIVVIIIDTMYVKHLQGFDFLLLRRQDLLVLLLEVFRRILLLFLVLLFLFYYYLIIISSSNNNICLIHLLLGVLLEDPEVGLQGLDLLLLRLLRRVVVLS